MRLPFSSLRTNLIAAFVAVIAVSLLLASGAFAYLLREYQVERERDRLESVAVYYTLAVGRWARLGRRGVPPSICSPTARSRTGRFRASTSCGPSDDGPWIGGQHRLAGRR